MLTDLVLLVLNAVASFVTTLLLARFYMQWARVSFRNQLGAFVIKTTDWAVLRAADQGEPVSPEWLAYRQALRDVTAQADPLNIAWPVAPAA